MHKRTLKDYDYYFQRNEFKKGSDKLIRSYRKAKFTDQGEILVDGIRLLLIAEGPDSATKVLASYRKRIHRTGPRSVLRMEYLRAEIAWQRGHFAETYLLLNQLRERLKGEFIQYSDRAVANNFREDLLADVDLLAGKCMTQENDHAMARIYFGRSYDHRHFDRESEQVPHFADGQIRMLFARSYFDWRKMRSIEKLLEKAEKLYGVPTGVKGERRGVHFHLAEVFTLQARYQVIKGLRKIGLKRKPHKRLQKREQLRARVDAKLKEAEKIIVKIFDRKHRCYAHIIRLRTYFHFEFTLESIRENSGKISEEDYQQLWKIEKCYLNEISIRKKFFVTSAHPSIARAYGLLAKSKILQATYLRQRGDAKAVMTTLKDAEAYVRQSISSNRKVSQEYVSPQAETMDKRVNPARQPNSNRNFSDNQTLQAKKFELEIVTTKYSTTYSEVEKKVLFKEIKVIFKDCQNILTKNLKRVTSPDSKESFFDVFEPIQERFIEICFEEYERKGARDEELVKLALHAMHQGRPIEEVNKSFHEDNRFFHGHKRKLRLLQTFNYRRLNEEGDLEKFANEVDIREEYNQMTREVFEEHHSYVEQHHNLLITDQDKSVESLEESFSFDAISKHFTGGEGVAVALHFGKKHAYSIAIQDERKRGVKRASFVRLTEKDQPYRGVMKLKRLAKSFNKVIRQLYDVKYWNKFSVNPDVPLSKEQTKEIERNLFERDSFIYDVKSREVSDRLNSRFLLYGFRLYRSVFSKLDIKSEDRVYIGINRYRWQRIPLRAIFTLNPKDHFQEGETIRFSHYPEGFIGTRQQVSVLPSIFELWRWGVTRGKSYDKNSFKNDRFYALAGGSNERHNSDFKQASEESTHSISKIFRDGYNRIIEFNDNKHVNKTVLENTTKTEIREHFERSAFIYVFLHTAKEYNEDGRRKIVLFAATPQEHLKKPSFLDTFKWDKHCLYQEELANYQLQNARLVFINSCLSADGRGSFGYVPYSTLSAAYAAGCRVVIGTQIKTYANAMRAFADQFYECWMNEGANDGNGLKNLPMGEAILYSSRTLARDPERSCTHPLHWGAYVQIGDMTTKFEDCLKHKTD